MSRKQFSDVSAAAKIATWPEENPARAMTGLFRSLQGWVGLGHEHRDINRVTDVRPQCLEAGRLEKCLTEIRKICICRWGAGGWERVHRN